MAGEEILRGESSGKDGALGLNTRPGRYIRAFNKSGKQGSCYEAFFSPCVHT